MTNLINENSIKKCVEYLAEPQIDEKPFREMLDEIEVKISEPKYDLFFPKDNEARNIYTVTIKRKDTGKRISFKFGDSIVNTQNDERPELYDILTCVGADLTVDETMTLNEFAQEFGSTNDIEESVRAYKAVINQKKRLMKIFNESHIGVFPS